MPGRIINAYGFIIPKQSVATFRMASNNDLQYSTPIIKFGGAFRRMLVVQSTEPIAFPDPKNIVTVVDGKEIHYITKGKARHIVDETGYTYWFELVDQFISTAE
jgi:hypothetical protein